MTLNFKRELTSWSLEGHKEQKDSILTLIHRIVRIYNTYYIHNPLLFEYKRFMTSKPLLSVKLELRSNGKTGFLFVRIN